MRGGKRLKLLVLLVPLLILGGCAGNSKDSQSANKLPTNYQTALKQAKGQTVTYYGFGGSDTQNRWIDQVVTPMMKKKGITVKRVPMDIDTILNKLTTEKEANKKQGNIDVVWINGENFYNAKKLGLLDGPLNNKMLPNMKRYISASDPDVKRDMATPIDQLEVPYGNAQFVMIGSKKIFNGNYPTSAAKLLDWAKANPGKLTYVAPPDFTGSAFIRNIIYETVGYQALNDAPATKAGIYKVIKPSLDYLNELKPYLWENGKTYPKTTAQMDKMFADHQIALDFSYNPMYAATQKSTGQFTNDAQTFLFDKGTIGNYNYLAVPKTAPNKAAAIVLINTMLSKKAQSEQLSLKYGAAIPPYSANKMPQEITDKLNDSAEKNNTVPVKTLAKKRIPEVSGKKIPIIEQLWKEHVLNAN
ncbi:ABC transporter substrate-binding protein [Loigolactobacillus backii]|uniref:ABC transporter substrate-binding protein n=1 Tax=Loigolactobacillus backii TaxID=375175 RepID=UPI0022FD4F46|nr:ABC transporter substrate-binding protein [Loigolactobacillus backii]MDA5386821.1 ABC transporter substrate-binding protein [Loigolactobacillus backii]MDA5389394.1 ABC transporter substrate-binding protein [Loigolactobacillus backii]